MRTIRDRPRISTESEQSVPQPHYLPTTKPLTIRTTYYANSYIKSVTDHSLGMIASFEYDREGNRTREAYTNTAAGAARVVYQLADISYDNANRIIEFRDAKATIQYEYDAVGNRRRVYSRYHDGINGDETIQDYWYLYDNLNRFTLTMGQFGIKGELKGPCWSSFFDDNGPPSAVP